MIDRLLAHGWPAEAGLPDHTWLAFMMPDQATLADRHGHRPTALDQHVWDHRFGRGELTAPQHAALRQHFGPPPAPLVRTPADRADALLALIKKGPSSALAAQLAALDDAQAPLAQLTLRDRGPSGKTADWSPAGQVMIQVLRAKEGYQANSYLAAFPVNAWFTPTRQAAPGITELALAQIVSHRQPSLAKWPALVAVQQDPAHWEAVVGAIEALYAGSTPDQQKAPLLPAAAMTTMGYYTRKVLHEAAGTPAQRAAYHDRLFRLGFRFHVYEPDFRGSGSLKSEVINRLDFLLTRLPLNDQATVLISTVVAHDSTAGRDAMLTRLTKALDAGAQPDPAHWAFARVFDVRNLATHPITDRLRAIQRAHVLTQQPADPTPARRRFRS